MTNPSALTVLAALGLCAGTFGCVPDEPSVFSGQVLRSKAVVTVAPKGSSAVVEVANPEGTGEAVVMLQSGEWPKRMVIRLRLKDLVEFSVASAGVGMSGDLKSGGTTTASYASRPEGEERPNTDMKIRRNGEWIEVILPSRFVSGKYARLSFSWKEK
jgi:hypothetical protein